MLMLQPITFVRRANLSERQPGNSSTVSPQGVTANSEQFFGIEEFVPIFAIFRGVGSEQTGKEQGIGNYPIRTSIIVEP
jgi:hypothetical protein